MKTLICITAALISLNSLAGVVIGDCRGKLQFQHLDKYCHVPNGEGEHLYELNSPVEFSTTSEVRALSTRFDSSIAEVKNIVAKNNLDINHLKDMVSSEIEIPAEVKAELKKELREELKEELKQEILKELRR